MSKSSAYELYALVSDGMYYHQGYAKNWRDAVRRACKLTSSKHCRTVDIMQNGIILSSITKGVKLRDRRPLYRRIWDFLVGLWSG
jgi:hypothetical protein